MASPPSASPALPLFTPYASPSPFPHLPPPLPPSSPPPPQKDYLEQLLKGSTIAADAFTLACFVAFGLLIGFDVWRAFKKRATWLPGKAFALSGVTVQIIVWWTSLSNVQNGYNKDIKDLLWFHFLVVGGRVAVCVFIAYLLPGMAAPSVRVFAALALTICARIVSELLLLYHPTYPGYINEDTGYDRTCIESFQGYGSYIDWDCIKESYSNRAKAVLKYKKAEVTWQRIADLIILICVVVLGLILCCTVLASKTIHRLLNQRISAISEKSDFEFSSEKLKLNSSIPEEERNRFSAEKTKMWEDFQSEVLKSWFVARICQDDYVISRSVFSSAVWIIVTICLIVQVSDIFSTVYYADIILSPLYGFIVIGYVVICWRWLATLLYCPPICSWRRQLYLEDFWTSRTVELIKMNDLKRERQEFQRIKSNKPSLNKSQSLPTKIFTKARLYRLLYLVLVLQVCVVFFCKVCGSISQLTLGNIVQCCRRFVCVCQKCTLKENQAESYESHKSILETICMPGEDTYALWEANRMSLNKTKRLMEKGCKEGISLKEINSIFCSYSLQWEEKGTQLLIDLKEKETTSVLKHFPSVEKHCLKMTVVSLMTILIGVHKAKSEDLTKVVKACHEVWDLLSFADECDIDLQADNINILDDLNEEKDQVLLAADREFYKLLNEYDKMGYDKLHSMRKDGEGEDAEKEEFLKKLQRDCEDILKKENLFEDNNKSSMDLHDSRKWTKIAPRYTLYKLCKFMLDKDIKNWVDWTQESLRNVIACSMSRLPNMLIKQFWIWAQKFEEDKLWEAIQLAGKCRGMMEEWGKDTKTILNTKQHKTLCQKFKMCILCCPREHEPNQREQPLSKTDQCRIDVNQLSV